MFFYFIMPLHILEQRNNLPQDQLQGLKDENYFHIIIKLLTCSAFILVIFKRINKQIFLKLCFNVQYGTNQYLQPTKTLWVLNKFKQHRGVWKQKQQQQQQTEQNKMFPPLEQNYSFLENRSTHNCFSPKLLLLRRNCYPK